VEENVVKGVVSVMLVLLLAGCSETVSPDAKSAARSYYAANHAQYGAALQGSGGYPL
jgi:predicted outer membrane protein